MTEKQLRNLLLKTITKIRDQNEKDKELSKQKMQIKLHEMMEKTYTITRNENNKYINMYKSQLNHIRQKQVYSNML